jgi:hypothetical protein
MALADVTPEDVLAEFDIWLVGRHDCEAKRWVQDNPPTAADAVGAVIHVLNIRMLRAWNPVAVSCG